MKRSSFIKIFSGAFLLCVFAMGITPKQVLHDVLTNHVHAQPKSEISDWVSKDRFNCDDENFVAESPFVSQCSAVQFNIPRIFQIKKDLFLFSYHFLHQFFFELRGPPFLS